MIVATYHGPKARLRISATGTVLVRGKATEVTAAEAKRLRASDANVSVVEPDPETERLRTSAALMGLDATGTPAEVAARIERGD